MFLRVNQTFEMRFSSTNITSSDSKWFRMNFLNSEPQMWSSYRPCCLVFAAADVVDSPSPVWGNSSCTFNRLAVRVDTFGPL